MKVHTCHIEGYIARVISPLWSVCGVGQFYSKRDPQPAAHLWTMCCWSEMRSGEQSRASTPHWHRIWHRHSIKRIIDFLIIHCRCILQKYQPVKDWKILKSFSCCKDRPSQLCSPNSAFEDTRACCTLGLFPHFGPSWLVTHNEILSLLFIHKCI